MANEMLSGSSGRLATNSLNSVKLMPLFVTTIIGVGVVVGLQVELGSGSSSGKPVVLLAVVLLVPDEVEDDVDIVIDVDDKVAVEVGA